MTEDYLIGTINVSILSYQDKEINNKKVTFYIIEIYNNYSKNKWTLEKRFNDFVEIHKTLSKLYPNCPQIPGKSLFKISSINEITKRKDGLENFMKSCVMRKDIMNSEFFRHFLEIENNSPELTNFTHKKINELVDLPLGVRDFVHLKHDRLLILALSDMNISSRLDAYFTNVNLPWEKKTNSHVTVGALIVYRYKQEGEAYYFDKLWTKSYPMQTGSVYWDNESSHLLVGLDNGIIICYKVAPELNYLQYDEICEINCHTNRVMGMSFDIKTGCILSVGSDKKFKITEIHYKECVSGNKKSKIELTVGNHGITNLIHDKKNLRAFITNEIGVIYIYSVVNNTPNLLFSLQSSTKSAMRGLHIDFLKYYIFTASTDGKICIFDLNQPGKERFIKEIGVLLSKKKMRIIKYHFSNHEIITGDEDGKISVWSLRGGEPLHVYEAHKGPITQLNWDEETKVLISAGKDKTMKFWKFPNKWRNEEIDKFEENEIKIQKDTAGMLRIQKSLTKDIEFDDSDDDLNGWDFKY